MSLFSYDTPNYENIFWSSLAIVSLLTGIFVVFVLNA